MTNEARTPMTDDEQEDARPRLSDLVARGRTRATGLQAWVTRQLARHQDRPMVDLAGRIIRRDRESAGTVLGSAVAFRLFLFFVPLLLFLVGVLGFLSTWIGSDDVREQTGITGGAAAQIETALSQPGSSRWAATIIGLIGMASAGRSLSKVMIAASCLAWGLPVRGRSPMRVVGGIIGLISGIGLVAVIVARIRTEFGLGAVGVSFLAAFAVYGLAWVALSSMLPRATRDPGALLPGGVLVGLTITGMQSVSQFYLPERVSSASQLYGSIGTTLVALGWFFLLGRAMVLSMTLSAVVHERFGSISEPVFSLPVLRSVRRRSPWVRRFFDLEE